MLEYKHIILDKYLLKSIIFVNSDSIPSKCQDIRSTTDPSLTAIGCLGNNSQLVSKRTTYGEIYGDKMESEKKGFSKILPNQILRDVGIYDQS